MADRLEAVVSSRERNSYGNKWLLKYPTTDQKEEVQEKMLGSPDNACAGENQILEDINGGAYKEFFLNLKSAISSDALTKNIQYLKHARCIARELVSK